MADSGIGPVTVKLSANAAGVDAGVKDAAKALESGAGKMADAAAKSADAVGKAWAVRVAEGIKGGIGRAIGGGEWAAGLAEKAIGDPGKFIAQNLVGGIGKALSSIPAVGAVLALPFEGVAAGMTIALDMYAEGAQRIKDMGAAAERAGVDLGQFQVIAGTLGDDVNAATLGIIKFREAALKAAMEGADGNNVFARMGIDAQELLKLPMDQQLGQFAEKMNGLGDRAFAAHAGMEVFGRGVAAMMPMFAKGQAGFDKTRNLLNTFGAGFGANDLASVRAAEMAKKEIAFFQQGISNQVTLGVAPMLVELASLLPKLSEMGLTPKGISGMVVDVAESIAMAGAWIADAFANPKAALEDIEALFERVKAGMLDAAGVFADALEAAVSRAISLTSRLGPKAEALGLGLKFALTGGGEAGAAGDQFRNRASAIRDAAALDEALRENERFWAEYDSGAKSAQTGTAEFFNKVRERMADTTAAAKEHNPFLVWQAQAKVMADSLETPMQKSQKEFSKIQALAGGGDLEKFFPALAGKKGFAIFQALQSAYGGGLGYTPVGAAEQGSAEAFRSIAEYQAGTQSVQEMIRKLIEEGNRIQQQNLDVGKQALEELRRQPGFGVKVKGVP